MCGRDCSGTHNLPLGSVVAVAVGAFFVDSEAQLKGFLTIVPTAVVFVVGDL